MKFTFIISALVASVSASTQIGLQMLQTLQTLEKNNEINAEAAVNLYNVRRAIVNCATIGSCYDEAAKMPNLY